MDEVLSCWYYHGGGWRSVIKVEAEGGVIKGWAMLGTMGGVKQ